MMTVLGECNKVSGVTLGLQRESRPVKPILKDIMR